MAGPLRAVKDKEPLVRVAAAANLDQLGAQARIRNAGPLLDDPVRLVRIEAARVLNSVRSGQIPSALLTKFKRASEEFREAQMAMADMPWAHLNLGVMYLDQGRSQDAEGAFQLATKLDPGFVPARVNLANLLNSQGRNEEAEAQLRESIRIAGDQGELHYNLGLLLAEMGRLEDAVRSLETATKLVPNRARIRYNYALALQQIGKPDEAEKALVEALRSEPEDLDILYALAMLLLQQGELERALRYAERVDQLQPDSAGARRLAARIRAQLGR
jgi:tetratricopeptide (TPR) repeat protein